MSTSNKLKLLLALLISSCGAVQSLPTLNYLKEHDVIKQLEELAMSTARVELAGASPANDSELFNKVREYWRTINEALATAWDYTQEAAVAVEDGDLKLARKNLSCAVDIVEIVADSLEAHLQVPLEVNKFIASARDAGLTTCQ